LRAKRSNLGAGELIEIASALMCLAMTPK